MAMSQNLLIFPLDFSKCLLFMFGLLKNIHIRKEEELWNVEELHNEFKNKKVFEKKEQLSFLWIIEITKIGILQFKLIFIKKSKMNTCIGFFKPAWFLLVFSWLLAIFDR